jgi:hypothetical protein
MAFQTTRLSLLTPPQEVRTAWTYASTAPGQKQLLSMISDSLLKSMFTDSSIGFVHGLTGNRETTWTDKSSKIFWPRDLLQGDLPDVRIMTFGYNVASQNRIGNHAQNLVNALAQIRVRSDTVTLGTNPSYAKGLPCYRRIGQSFS